MAWLHASLVVLHRESVELGRLVGGREVHRR